jgi:uncharacterized protein (DUF2141 family)
MKNLILMVSVFLITHTSFGADVVVNLTGLQAQGQLMVALHRNETTFDNESATPFKYSIVKVVSSSTQVVFSGIPAGEYAVSLIHDKNNNKKLDINLMGIPIEPFGFSNNPRILTGPPRFQECSFNVNATDKKSLAIKMIQF